MGVLPWMCEVIALDFGSGLKNIDGKIPWS